jgi:hypothetical protein
MIQKVFQKLFSKPGETDPWYQKHGRGQPLHGLSERPPVQDLPDYLQDAQNTVNHLFELGSQRTEQQHSDLEEYMEEMEPKSLKKIHEQYKAKLIAYQKKPDWTVAREADERKHVMDEFDKEKKKYRKKAGRWLNKIGSDGAQFMIEEPGKPNTKAPGVFYFPDEGALDPDVEVAIDTINESVIMNTYQHGWKSV